MKPVPRQLCLWLALAAATAGLGSGCWPSPSAHTVGRNYSLGQAPVEPPTGHDRAAFDDFTTGGLLFKMHCGSCHTARPLAERPFANYEVAVAHMRQQAYLTGKEYRQLIHFLRRWHDVGPASPDVPPSPKRFFFSQPLSELRDPSAMKTAPPDDSMPKRSGEE